MKTFKFLCLAILLTNCNTLKQPNHNITEKLIVQILSDLRYSNQFEDVEPLRVLNNEFIDAIYGSSSQTEFEYFYEKNYLIFNHFLNCNNKLKNIFNVSEHKSYYYNQTLISDVILDKQLIKADNKSNNKKEYLKLSKPFISPKKDYAIILVESTLLGGGVLKVYQLQNNKWRELCKFQSMFLN